MNLILAGAWLAVTLALLWLSWFNTDAPVLKLFGTGLSTVWLAAAMVVFNLVRWWTARQRKRQRELEALLQAYRRPRAESRPWTPPNPDFDFSDHPPRDGDSSAIRP